MTSITDRTPSDDSATNAPRNAGAVGLAHELAAQPLTALLAQQRAITAAARQCPDLWPLASLRWTLLVAELAARKRLAVAS